MTDTRAGWFDGDVRQVANGPLTQGTAEQLAYQFVFPQGATPEEAVCILWDVTTGEFVDVSAAHLAGEVTTEGHVVTSPLTHDLAHQHVYRLDCLAWVRGNRLGPFVVLHGRQ